MWHIDLNCDLGEGCGNDKLLMPFISSCSIACGGHFGTAKTIATAIELAKAHGVLVGPHPSYPDIAHFGRRTIDMPLQSLQAALREQLRLFFKQCPDPHHIKAHGALYNDLFTDIEKADAVTEVFAEFAKGIKLYSAPGSQLAIVAAQKGFQVVYEAFADRAYLSDGTLAPRAMSDAVLSDNHVIAKRVVNLIKNKTITTITGTIMPLTAQTICLHGDGADVVAHAAFLSHSLKQNNIHVQGL
jgi:5-oxoprolinase (ATP-hydrolysing) subunit A